MYAYGARKLDTRGNPLGFGRESIANQWVKAEKCGLKIPREVAILIAEKSRHSRREDVVFKT